MSLYRLSDTEGLLVTPTGVSTLPLPAPDGGGGEVIVPSGQITFAGRSIYDASNTRIVPRGPELTFPGSGIADLDAIAATGANAIRVLITTDAINGVTPEALGAFLDRVAFHDMIAWVSFYTWNEASNFAIAPALGGGNFFTQTAPEGYGVCSTDSHGPCYLSMWDRQWVKDVMAAHRSHVILDAMQEYIAPQGVDPGSEAGGLAWRDAAISSVQFFRSRGYTHPLAVMASYQGRDLARIVQHAQAILDADTVKVGGQSQIIFGWQAYWSSTGAPGYYPGWQGSLLLGAGQSLTATQAIDTILPTLPYPVQAGFDNYPDDTASDWQIQIEAAERQDNAWLWWDWRNGQLDCPLDGATCRTYVLTSQAGFAGARTALSGGGGGGAGDGTPVGGKTVNEFGYVNSLDVFSDPSKDQNASTRVPNWIQRFADAAPNGGNNWTFGGQFGFFPQWAVPPRAFVKTEEAATIIDEYNASWTGASQIEVVSFVPDNFDGVWFDPSAVTNMGAAYVPTLLALIDAWETNAPNTNRRYAVYAGWPQLNGYGGSNDDPTTVNSTGYANWVAWGLGTYQTWMETLVAQLQAARPALDIRLHNINKATLMAFRDTVVSTVPVGTLFQDLSPHGRETWYFLAGVAEYMELYGEKPPAGFAFNPAWNVHATVTANYQAIVDHMWGVLNP